MLIAAKPKAIELQAKLFRGFGDPGRLAILEALSGGPRTVTEIILATGLNQSNASNHLRCLRDCGLVKVEQQGRFAWYSLSDLRIKRLLRLADELLADVAKGIYECTRYTAIEE